jgi:hypothetical protein
LPRSFFGSPAIFFSLSPLLLCGSKFIGEAFFFSRSFHRGPNTPPRLVIRNRWSRLCGRSNVEELAGFTEKGFALVTPVAGIFFSSDGCYYEVTKLRRAARILPLFSFSI